MFEWDKSKAEKNKNKHQITFEEASTVFFDPGAFDGPDLKHSETEPRFLRIGTSVTGKILVVAYTIRRTNEKINQIRIISARKANPKERKFYSQ